MGCAMQVLDEAKTEASAKAASDQLLNEVSKKEMVNLNKSE